MAYAETTQPFRSFLVGIQIKLSVTDLSEISFDAMLWFSRDSKLTFPCYELISDKIYPCYKNS